MPMETGSTGCLLNGSHRSNQDIDIGHTNGNKRQPRELFSVQQRRIVLYTLHRSGSTFVGEILGRHPDVYYMFEPFQLYPFGMPDKEQHISCKAETLLGNILECDLRPLLDDIKSQWKGSHRINAFADSVFCAFSGVRNDTQHLKASLKSHDLRDCNPYDVDEIRKKCRSKGNVVTKLVSLKNISSLVPLMRQGIKVVHLVRDPRGQIESIRRMGPWLDQYGKMSVGHLANHICQVLRDGILTIGETLKHDPKVKRNYRRIRFEDVSKDPMSCGSKLYEFTGLPMENPNALNWLYKSTISKRQGISSSYSVAWSWRARIAYVNLLRIQSVCGDVLETLGYIKVHSLPQLRNLSESLHGFPNEKEG